MKYYQIKKAFFKKHIKIFHIHPFTSSIGENGLYWNHFDFNKPFLDCLLMTGDLNSNLLVFTSQIKSVLVCCSTPVHCRTHSLNPSWIAISPSVVLVTCLTKNNNLKVSCKILIYFCCEKEIHVTEGRPYI